MTLFWVGVLLFAIIVLFFLLLPLFSTSNKKRAPQRYLAYPFALLLAIATLTTTGYLLQGNYTLWKNSSTTTVTPQSKITQQQTLSALQQKIRGSPEQSELWYQLGKTYLYQQQFSDALQAFEQAITLSEATASLLSAKATTLYYQQGQRLDPTALQWLQQALQLDPINPTALMLLAENDFFHGRYNEAIAKWQTLLDSDHPELQRHILIEAIKIAEMQR